LRRYAGGHRPASLGLNVPPADGLRDALAGNPNPINASNPGLHLSNSDNDQLRDSVAGNAIPGGHNGNGPHGNTEDETPPPPRGGDHSGVGSFSNTNPGSEIPPNGPGPLSPSAPASPFQPR
jgi:hypothetical protein